MLGLVLACLVTGIVGDCSFPATISESGEYKDVVYGTISVRQKLDVYTSRLDGDPLPTVIFIHGGGWRGGAKSSIPSWLIDELVPRGFVVASTNYRLSSEAIFPATIDDVEAAIVWLKENAQTYNIDPTRIIAIGSSAGGHLVSLLGTRNEPDDPARVKAVINFYGPCTLIFGPSVQIQQLLGCDDHHVEGTECYDLALSGSPLSRIRPDNPPFLHLQGSADTTVPPEGNIYFDSEMKKAGVDSEIVIAEGAGHSKNEVIAKMYNDTATIGEYMYEWIYKQACNSDDNSDPIDTDDPVDDNNEEGTGDGSATVSISLGGTVFVLLSMLLIDTVFDFIMDEFSFYRTH